MWRDTNLLGRDNLLAQKIRPRLREKRGFVITGPHGIGKTALLEWCSEHAPCKVAMVSATWTVKEILVKICQAWDLEVTNDDGDVMPKSRWQVAWLENAVLAESGNWIMVDDIHMVTPAILRRLKVLRDRCWIVGAGVPPFRREELRRLLWGLPEVKVEPLKKSDMTRLATAAAPIVGSRTPVSEAVHAARGIPAQLLHALRGEVTPETTKTKGEEIDLSPIFLVVLVIIMMTRYIGKGLESTSLVMLGGFGMAIGLVLRFVLFKGMR